MGWMGFLEHRKERKGTASFGWRMEDGGWRMEGGEVREGMVDWQENEGRRMIDDPELRAKPGCFSSLRSVVFPSVVF